MGYVRIADLYPDMSGSRESDDATRKRLHDAALALISRADTAPVNALGTVVSQADTLTAEVNSYQPWPENTFPCWTCYPNSTTVRNNIYAARNNALRRMGDTSRTQITASQPVSLVAETARAMPAAVTARAQEIAQGNVWTAEQRQVVTAPLQAVGVSPSVVPQATAPSIPIQNTPAPTWWDRAVNFATGTTTPPAPAPAPRPTPTAPQAAPTTVGGGLLQASGQSAAGVAYEANRALASIAQQTAAAANVNVVNALWTQALSVSSQAANEFRRLNASGEHFTSVQNALIGVRTAKDQRLAQLSQTPTTVRTTTTYSQAPPPPPKPPEQPLFSTADKLNIFTSITSAAATIGTAFAQGKAELAVAKASRPVMPQMPTLQMPQFQQQAPAAPQGLGTTEIAMIGVGVGVLALAGIILVSRSGDDED